MERCGTQQNTTMPTFLGGKTRTVEKASGIIISKKVGDKLLIGHLDI